MPRPLLPPRGIFVPTGLVFNAKISKAELRTWLQLRALAWGKTETPPFSVEQFASLTGTKHTAFYGHLSALRDQGALRWRTADRGTLIVSFPEDSLINEHAGKAGESPGAVEYTDPGANAGAYAGWSADADKHALADDSGKAEMPDPPVNSPGKEDSLYLSGKEEESFLEQESFEEGGVNFRKSGNIRISGKVQAEKGAAPVQLYRSKTGYSPNAPQRGRMIQLVTDLERWEATLEHWLSHGWNPRNLTGMLELYSRGGPAGCRHCKRDPQGGGGGEKGSSLERSLRVLEQFSDGRFDG